MRIVIADDEPLARRRLARLLEELPNDQLVGEAANGEEAILRCSELHPDVLLLDIRMPGLDGIATAKELSKLEHPPAIIFTTAYDSHALSAFETQACAYLLKPIRLEQLQHAIEKAQRLNLAQLAILEQSDNTKGRTHISVQVGGSTRLIPVSEIAFFRAEQKYVTLQKGNQQYLIEEPLKELEEEFKGQFIRIHRNALVALKAIAALHRDEEGHYSLQLHDQPERLDVSRRLVSQVKAILKQKQ